jgi:cell division protein FtsQ
MAPSWLSRHRAVRTGLASSRVRFERRAAAVRQRPARLIAAAVGLGVGLALVAWLVFFSSVLALREVRVDGVDDTDKAAVLAAVTVAPGTPLARVDLGSVESAVQKVAFVRDVQLRVLTKATTVGATARRTTWPSSRSSASVAVASTPSTG